MQVELANLNQLIFAFGVLCLAGSVGGAMVGTMLVDVFKSHSAKQRNQPTREDVS
ncbi:hypothetical protein PAN31117_04829 [Pandoraea anapnoica]|uniref:Uncharacterized protein n=1 Tax=Pandoraea anapnoica TaxID=2508301 RepID=A0A5E5API2_9BURK|nr:hypothetical protein PAN31117_04829 [Pandoraea anapnoica]